MGAATLISVEEYLNTSYEPDRDFIDGVLVRRHMGTQLHGSLQLIVGSYLRQSRKSHRIRVFTETRLLVDAAASRYRVPDVMALEIPYKRGKIVTDVPGIVVEIKSPDDTFDDVFDRAFDYEKLGASNILVMDPEHRRAWLFQQGNLELVSGTSVDLRLPRQDLSLEFPIASIFAELDEE